MSIQRVPSHAEFTQVIQSQPRVAVFFSASWCSVCGKMRPFFEEYAAKYANIRCIEVDEDENLESMTSAGVQSVPTFRFYKDGLPSTLGDVQGNWGQLQETMDRLSEQ